MVEETNLQQALKLAQGLIESIESILDNQPLGAILIAADAIKDSLRMEVERERLAREKLLEHRNYCRKMKKQASDRTDIGDELYWASKLTAFNVALNFFPTQSLQKTTPDQFAVWL